MGGRQGPRRDNGKSERMCGTLERSGSVDEFLTVDMEGEKPEHIEASGWSW